MVEVLFNGVDQPIDTIEALGQALDQFDSHTHFELWCTVPDGPSLLMLRCGGHAWLMYLRFTGDAGLHSVSVAEREGTGSYLLANGQKDHYPVAWCIDLEQCYKAVAYFFVNAGERAPWVHWHEDQAAELK